MKRANPKPRPPRRKPLPVAAKAAINAAIDADAYLLAVFSVANGEVRLHRFSHRFPNGDLPVAIELLGKDFQSITD